MKYKMFPMTFDLFKYFYFQSTNGTVSGMPANKPQMNFLLTDSQQNTLAQSQPTAISPSPVKLLTHPILVLPNKGITPFTQAINLESIRNTPTNGLNDFKCDLNVITKSLSTEENGCKVSDDRFESRKEAFLDYLSEFENFEPIYDDIEFSYDDPFQII